MVPSTVVLVLDSVKVVRLAVVYVSLPVRVMLESLRVLVMVAVTLNSLLVMLALVLVTVALVAVVVSLRDVAVALLLTMVVVAEEAVVGDIELRLVEKVVSVLLLVPVLDEASQTTSVQASVAESIARRSSIGAVQ
jgi:hypothetical protein